MQTCPVQTQQRLQAQIHGGGHEGGLRSGTLATHQIAGMGAAFALAAEAFDAEGGLILQIFGYRKDAPPDAWNAVVAALPPAR